MGVYFLGASKRSPCVVPYANPDGVQRAETETLLLSCVQSAGAEVETQELERVVI